ncbi:MAG TPA: TIGR01212 family radical SAM protein [Bacteroidales bacterium]|nr:TIGR01212 family radical SAM protein [Bacteroidales bacterium]
MNEAKPYPWGNSRRFNAYSSWFTALAGKRVQKVSLDAGFTCPNRDGTKGTGGCTYCSNDAFSPAYCTPDRSVTQQLDQGIAFHQRRYRRADTYLAYFQAYSNTYAGIDRLKMLYGEALAHPSVVGLVIGTRPDCVNDTLLDYLAEMNRSHIIIVEYGIESVYDETLKSINRGHDFAASVSAVTGTASRGIPTGGHLIFGLPGESRDQIIASASVVSELPLNSVKIHQLQLIRGTVLAKEYTTHPERFDLYTLEEYIDLAVAFAERLNPSIMIERISGEAPSRMLADPRNWHLRSNEIFILFEKQLETLGTWQGRLYKTK